MAPNARPPSRPSSRPSSRQTLGRDGEAQAARFLEARGYRIVARNVRAARVEIDLIVRRGPLLVFVEVKSRRSQRYGSAAESVDDRKQSRLRRGASAWLADTRAMEETRGVRRIRFDVVTCRLASDHPGERSQPGPEARSPNEATAPGGTRWQIEHWQDAF